MAKTKLFVTYNGKVIGKRSTDRKYTHCLVLDNYDGQIDRDRSARAWLEHGVKNARDHIAYCRQQVAAGVGGITHHSGNGGRPFTLNVDQRNYDDAIKFLAGLTDEQLMVRRQEDHTARMEQFIAERAAKGPSVLSFHGSRDLAFKAQAAAREIHAAHLVLVHPVDAN